jgi:hypothetical protein
MSPVNNTARAVPTVYLGKRSRSTLTAIFTIKEKNRYRICGVFPMTLISVFPTLAV